MKRTITVWSLFGILWTATCVHGQDNRVFTRPTPPSVEMLERMNLKLAWRSRIPTDGNRDGLYSVQPLGSQILVQTVSGTVCLVDAVDGGLVWRARPGNAYRATQPLGWNDKLVLVTQGPRLFGLDRVSGRPQWELTLPNVPTAAPVADEERFYVAAGTGRLYVFELSQQQSGKSKTQVATAPGRSVSSSEYTVDQRFEGGAQPERIWEYRANAPIEQPPLLNKELVMLAASDGTFQASLKEARQFVDSYPLGSPITAALGQHNELVYVASQDLNLYAFSVGGDRRIRMNWRFASGAPIRRRPAAQDDDVYAMPDRLGLFRLRRDDGEQLWHNQTAARFLAANKKFVYAADRIDRLLILDRLRGTQLSVLDTHEYNVPVVNELTDRFFLASNDGQLLCLHDRDYRTALVMKTPPPADKEPKKDKEEPKAEAKPDDEKVEKKAPKKEEKKEEKKVEKKEEKKEAPKPTAPKKSEPPVEKK